MAFIGCVLAGLWLGILFHEAGHFACARACGLRVMVVSIGRGPLLANWRTRDTNFEFRWVPSGGFVQAYLISDGRGWKQTLFTLGGILGNIALLILLAFLDASAANSALHAAIVPIAGVQYALIVLSLLPLSHDETASDGLLLLRTWLYPRNTPLYLQYQLAAYQSKSGISRSSRRFLARIGPLIANADQRMPPAECENLRSTLESEISRGGLTVGEELLALDALLTRGLQSGGATNERLDRWSKRAIELGAHLATIRASRGTVLCALGRYDAAIALLETVPTGTDAPLLDVVMTKLFLAQAQLGLGERETACRLMTEARAATNIPETFPGLSKLIERLETQISAKSM